MASIIYCSPRSGLLSSKLGIEADLEGIARQERELRFARFDAETAWRLGARMRETAAARALPAALDIRRFGMPMFYCALEGSNPDNAEWVRRKSNIVARFHRSSYSVGLGLKRDGATLQSKFGLADADYAAHGGSFPVIAESAGVIGSITVSGLPQRADHEFAVEMLCLEFGRDYTQFRLDLLS